MFWFSQAHGVFRMCGAVPGGPVLLASMFTAGLFGSAAHCAPMCGPIVVGQVADRLSAIPAIRLCELSRLRSAVLIPYHAGRLLTYAGLGAVAATAGGFALSFGPAPAIMLTAAGLLCALGGWRRLAPRRLRPRAASPGRAGRMLVRLGARIDRSRLSGGFLLGVLLGFLPCGLLYAALIAAASTHAPAEGAAAMAAFGLGTVPALVAVGLAGARRAAAGRAGGAIMLANAALLWVLAGKSLLF